MKPEDFGYIIKNNILAFQKGPLSQWYGAYKNQGGPIQFFSDDGNFYNCCEQYMMHRKSLIFGDEEIANKILQSKNPKEQKKLGRLVNGFREDVWVKNRMKIVFDANYYKFTQNPELEKFLTRTRGLKLVEAAPWDEVWGCGTGPEDERTFNSENWQGLNLLGKSLMLVRALILT